MSSTISLSKRLEQFLVEQFFNWGAEGGSGMVLDESFTFTTPYNSSFAQIRLMSGSVPSDFSSLTNGLSRSSDLLWSVNFNYSNIDVINSEESGSTNIRARLNTGYAQATATGIATWFWWIVSESGIYPTIRQQIVGTVGGLNSGADLVMGDTTIVSGAQYRIVDFRLGIPSTFSY